MRSVEPSQEENGHRTASEIHVRCFWMSQMSVVVGKAVVDQSAVRARRPMPLGVGMRVQKVWGELVGYRPSNEGVLLRPSLEKDCANRV